MGVKVEGRELIITGGLATRILKGAAVEKMDPDEYVIMCLSEYVAKVEKIQEMKDAK